MPWHVNILYIFFLTIKTDSFVFCSPEEIITAKFWMYYDYPNANLPSNFPSFWTLVILGATTLSCCGGPVGYSTRPENVFTLAFVAILSDCSEVWDFNPELQVAFWSLRNINIFLFYFSLCHVMARSKGVMTASSAFLLLFDVFIGQLKCCFIDKSSIDGHLSTELLELGRAAVCQFGRIALNADAWGCSEIGRVPRGHVWSNPHSPWRRSRRCFGFIHGQLALGGSLSQLCLTGTGGLHQWSFGWNFKVSSHQHPSFAFNVVLSSEFLFIVGASAIISPRSGPPPGTRVWFCDGCWLTQIFTAGTLPELLYSGITRDAPSRGCWRICRRFTIVASFLCGL